MTTRTIDIVSDTVCPWCYIGKRKLEAALSERTGDTFVVRWRPYQLNPDMPAQGRDRKEALLAKFGSEEKLRELGAVVKQAGQQVGLALDFEKIDRSPNTLDSHRLIRWAGSAGVQDAVVDALFNAYFVDGKDISDRQVLLQVAGQCGMDTALVARLLDSDEDRDLVRNEEMQARAMGVQGVPFFIFDGRVALSGAQDPSVFHQAIDKAAEAMTGAT